MKPSIDFGRALAKLEDATSWEGCAHDATCTPDQRIALSTAISLKRIADALNEPNAYGEVGSEAIANSIARGLGGNAR